MSTEENTMSSRLQGWARRALPCLVLVLAGLIAPGAQAAPTATLTTDRGCGGSARYAFGELITFRYTVSETSVVTLTLTRPDGFVTRPVFQQTVPAGVTQTVTGIAGNGAGPRQLLLNATSATGSTQVECIYYVEGGTPQPPPGQFTASVTTDRGCGATAVYQIGETSVFRVTVSQNASVTLRLQYPDGSVRTLLFNEPLAAGAVRTISGIIGNPPGQRRLILDATSGGQTVRAECTYSTGSTQPPPGQLTASVTTDRGCGATAVYQLGETSVFRVTVSQNAFVTLRLQARSGRCCSTSLWRPARSGPSVASSATRRGSAASSSMRSQDHRPPTRSARTAQPGRRLLPLGSR
jgi:hypothetical protein